MSKDIRFSQEEKDAFLRVSDPHDSEPELTMFQQNDLRMKWSDNVEDKQGPIPSMKGVTITQAKELYKYWGVDDDVIMSDSAPQIEKITWIIIALAIIILLVIGWLLRPVGLIAIAILLVIFGLMRVVGSANDRLIQFNSLRARVLANDFGDESLVDLD